MYKQEAVTNYPLRIYLKLSDKKKQLRTITKFEDKKVHHTSYPLSVYNMSTNSCMRHNLSLRCKTLEVLFDDILLLLKARKQPQRDLE